MDLVLHLHPAPEAPAPAIPHPGAARRTRLEAALLTVYTKGDLLSAPRAAPSSSARRSSSPATDGMASLPRPARAHPRGSARAASSPTIPTTSAPSRSGSSSWSTSARPPSSCSSDELPYGFTAEVEEFREAERPVYIRVTLFVERESQKGIVIGARRRHHQGDRRPRAAPLEELIGAPVYLDCWVKVLPHWRKSAAALTRFGFP